MTISVTSGVITAISNGIISTGDSEDPNIDLVCIANEFIPDAAGLKFVPPFLVFVVGTGFPASTSLAPLISSEFPRVFLTFCINPNSPVLVSESPPPSTR